MAPKTENDISCIREVCKVVEQKVSEIETELLKLDGKVDSRIAAKISTLIKRCQKTTTNLEEIEEYVKDKEIEEQMKNPETMEKFKQWMKEQEN